MNKKSYQSNNEKGSFTFIYGKPFRTWGTNSNKETRHFRFKNNKTILDLLLCFSFKIGRNKIIEFN